MFPLPVCGAQGRFDDYWPFTISYAKIKPFINGTGLLKDMRF